MESCFSGMKNRSNWQKTIKTKYFPQDFLGFAIFWAKLVKFLPQPSLEKGIYRSKIRYEFWPKSTFFNTPLGELARVLLCPGRGQLTLG